MTTTTGKTGNDECGLLPYPVIIAVTKGEPQARNMACQHYAGYIARLSMRKFRDERENTCYGIDEDIRDRLRSKLMQTVSNSILDIMVLATLDFLANASCEGFCFVLSSCNRFSISPLLTSLSLSC